MKKLNVKGSDVLLDSDDYEKFKDIKWSISPKGYVCAPGTLKIHRLVTQCPAGLQVDHINGNKLDNRKSNLRICTNSQNQFNIKTRRRKYGYLKGAYKKVGAKGRIWWSQILIPESNPKKLKYLGSFYTEQEAHEAYVKASLELHGEFSYFARDAS